MKQLVKIVRRELLIILKRPVYILASVGVLIVNAVFYITFMKDGLPHDLPIGLVDEDHSSTSRTFARELDGTQLGKVVYYDDIHLAREHMETGRITSFIVIPKGFNADIQAFRQPHISYYVNSLYFVGGALAYKDILTMVNLTNGAVQRQVLRLKGMNEREIMGRIQPIVLDQHQIGNPAVNYGVYLNGVLLPGVLEMIVILITIYAVGSELKYGTSKHLLKTAGGSVEMALLGKLLPYNIIFTVLGIALELLLFHWLKYPLKGHIGWMFLDILLLVSASEALGLFIVPGTEAGYQCGSNNKRAGILPGWFLAPGGSHAAVCTGVQRRFPPEALLSISCPGDNLGKRLCRMLAGVGTSATFPVPAVHAYRQAWTCI